MKQYTQNVYLALYVVFESDLYTNIRNVIILYLNTHMYIAICMNKL